MITVKMEKENTTVEFDGKFGDLMVESVAAVRSIGKAIIAKEEHPEELLYFYVNALIDAVWDK